mmetsp:Transcript_29515/g.67417  ORF Transcript_29515/g.67417 Transcript_29515/m.67417 type:complete len:305 (-) Transcript_29515:51-965(-)
MSSRVWDDMALIPSSKSKLAPFCRPSPAAPGEPGLDGDGGAATSSSSAGVTGCAMSARLSPWTLSPWKPDASWCRAPSWRSSARDRWYRASRAMTGRGGVACVMRGGTIGAAGVWSPALPLASLPGLVDSDDAETSKGMLADHPWVPWALPLSLLMVAARSSSPRWQRTRSSTSERGTPPTAPAPLHGERTMPTSVSQPSLRPLRASGIWETISLSLPRAASWRDLGVVGLVGSFAMPSFPCGRMCCDPLLSATFPFCCCSGQATILDKDQAANACQRRRVRRPLLCPAVKKQVTDDDHNAVKL